MAEGLRQVVLGSSASPTRARPSAHAYARALVLASAFVASAAAVVVAAPPSSPSAKRGPAVAAVGGARPNASSPHTAATKPAGGARRAVNAPGAKTAVKPGARAAVKAPDAKAGVKGAGNAAVRAGQAARPGLRGVPSAATKAAKGKPVAGVRAAARPGPAGKPGKAPAAAAPSADEVPRPADDDPDRARIVRLQDTLASITGGGPLGGLRVGMRVLEARSGRVLFGKRRHVLMDPASNQKVLATVTALMRLGPEWRYRTELVGPAPGPDGVVAGDVVLRGSGDPTLRSADLAELARALARLGVKRIAGGVVGDTRRLGPVGAGAPVLTSSPGRAAGGGTGDVTAPEGAVGGHPPLLVGGGTVSVRVRPGTQGKSAEASARPWAPGWTLRNHTVTRPGARARVQVVVSLAGGHVVVDVSGSIGVRHRGLVVNRRLPQPALHAATLLAAELGEAGVAVQGAPRSAAAAPTAGAMLLAAHQSRPLSMLVAHTNKISDNEYAERLLETVGAEVLGGAATTSKGLVVLRDVIGSLGLEAGDYAPANGSGLGHNNRVTAEAMGRLLRAIYLDPRVGPDLVQSLSVGGIDGTTRNRFRGTPSAKRVRSKTGTLRSVSCLSGYVGDGDEIIVYSILVEGFRQRAITGVRAAQVAAVNAMMRYVREAGGATVDLPLLPPATATDVEGGQSAEPDEGESEGESDASGEDETEDADESAAPGESLEDVLKRAR